MPEPDWSYSTHWLTACTLDPKLAGVTRMQLIQRLSEEMIEARPLWKPMHRQPVFGGFRYFADARESVSDRLFENGLCLPSGSNIPAASLQRVAEVLRRVLTQVP
jgi:dTDP-4-amino-4,6-dideoxygalactose transaminase